VPSLQTIRCWGKDVFSIVTNAPRLHRISSNPKTQLESCGKNPFEIREYDIRVDLARSLSSNEGRNVRDSYRASEAKGS